MVFNFKEFPELTNNQMQFYYWDSPHKQISESFDCKVVRVIDGDTILVRWSERDFDFPVRFIGINSPELKTEGGFASKSWLEEQIQDAEIHVIVNPLERVGKFGRILGEIVHAGININDASVVAGHSKVVE